MVSSVNLECAAVHAHRLRYTVHVIVSLCLTVKPLVVGNNKIRYVHCVFVFIVCIKSMGNSSCYPLALYNSHSAS